MIEDRFVVFYQERRWFKWVHTGASAGFKDWEEALSFLEETEGLTREDFIVGEDYLVCNTKKNRYQIISQENLWNSLDHKVSA
jgi:hypothetical protein